MERDRARPSFYELLTLAVLGVWGALFAYHLVLGMNLGSRRSLIMFSRDEWEVCHTVVCAAVAPLTLGITWLGWLKRRAGHPEVFQKPGMAGCGSAAIAICLEGLRDLPLAMLGYQGTYGAVSNFVGSGHFVSWAVVGALLALGMSSKWSWGRGWLEWIGVAVVVVWMFGVLGLVLATLIDGRQLLLRSI